MSWLGRRSWGGAPRERGPGGRSSDRKRERRPPRSLVVALVLACASMMLLDQDRDGRGGTALDPLRQTVGEVVGPVQEVTATAVRPFAELSGFFRTRQTMRAELAGLEAQNAELRTRLRASDYDRQRLAELEGLVTTAQDLGRSVVPARVVAVGPSQSFSSTVTLDAGSEAGIAPDMTVINRDGLVGRVLRVTRSTATILLLVDPESTVGGRVAQSMELGFLRGRGAGQRDRLDLELVDRTEMPTQGDTVVTWGSGGAGPYVAGVPVGEVTEVYSSLREGTQRAVIDPFVDFSTLDVVGVVVPAGTPSDRGVIEADGSLR